jgi:flagellar biosynthetic protein FliP
MGFVLFLPFVVIDLVISSILVSMGMFTLPPVVVSTPLKLMLFILVGGWDLVVRSVVESYPQV